LTAVQNYTPEVFTLSYDGITSLAINGGSGVNILDYSGFSGPVTVDLPLGLATGVAGGISNIRNVVGGPGNDLFVGKGGNVLTGGTGRNLLIAGASASTLVGGRADNILISGTTAYDMDLPSLQAIMACWAGSDDYKTRVAKLANGNGVPLLDATTVTGNGGGNTLIGRSGIGFVLWPLGPGYDQELGSADGDLYPGMKLSVRRDGDVWRRKDPSSLFRPLSNRRMRKRGQGTRTFSLFFPLTPVWGTIDWDRPAEDRIKGNKDSRPLFSVLR
jgi:hypothetical protein